MNIADIAINTSSSAFDFFFGFFDCSEDFTDFKDSDFALSAPSAEPSALSMPSVLSENSANSENPAKSEEPAISAESPAILRRASAVSRRASAFGSPNSLPLYRRFTLLLAFPLSRDPHYA
ncbi:hypothetical protein PMM76_08360 [Bifidobacterium pseudocatenulatum]|uniref:hypothetical protein n=1 Tax=Bifidobacterium pseudocatenulatum TaxID=28026 RepID=UPI001E5AA9E9|nr:hypothetical protein [Bifidobacterium pseudocatenulatum]MDB6512119.1 hypothetical protein [Bifidobacterium pseudocatenulatum]MDB6515732.1 hypothetical protein [Bifidobacterium pseudocatenulatum]